MLNRVAARGVRHTRKATPPLTCVRGSDRPQRLAIGIGGPFFVDQPESAAQILRGFIRFASRRRSFLRKSLSGMTQRFGVPIASNALFSRNHPSRCASYWLTITNQISFWSKKHYAHRGWCAIPRSFSDGEAVLQRVLDTQRERLDLIVLDIHLTRISGLELLEKFRSHRRLDDTPVAILTSSLSPVQRDQALRLRADAFVSKPTQLDEFLTEVGHHP